MCEITFAMALVDMRLVSILTNYVVYIQLQSSDKISKSMKIYFLQLPH